MNWTLAIVAVAVLGVAAVSRQFSGTPVTPAMVFVAIGVLVGPLVLDDIDVAPQSSMVRTLAEATLTLVLFCDASRIDARKLRRESMIPMRLLGIGLPLTIAFGSLVAAVLFGQLSVTEAIIVGVILAPTDAGLGEAVVTDVRLPLRIRQSLNVESGLNDGICVPLLLIALAAASGSGHTGHVLLEEIGWGLVAGVGAGGLAALVVKFADGRHLIEGSWRQLIPVAAAALAYGIAVGLGGSGFIAAFVAGLMFGTLLRAGTGEITIFADEAGALLDGVTFLFFGAVLLGPTLEHVTGQMFLYAILSLTVVRMLPVAISLWGTKAQAPTVALVGWLGPRGLASIVFAVIVQDADLGGHISTIIAATYLTIGLSVLLHGLSAAPLVSRYANWYRGHPEDMAPAMESRPTPEFRARGPVPHAAIPGGRGTD